MTCDACAAQPKEPLVKRSCDCSVLYTALLCEGGSACALLSSICHSLQPTWT